MIKKYTLLRLISVILILSLCVGLLGACDQDRGNGGEREGEHEGTPDVTVRPGEGDDDFALMMDELFEDWVTSDSISMNYFLAYPGRLGIDMPTPTFGEVATPESMRESIQENLDLLERLRGFRYEDLSIDQQIVYDLLMRNLDLIGIMDSNEDFAYYIGYIRPLNGIQVQLPILLAEFNFRTVEDIEIYLELLGDTRRYFDEIIEFERERSRRGFFTSDANVDRITEHIESFLEDREDNLLILIFEDRIDGFPGLGADERDEFKRRNRDLVLNNVLAAYDALLQAMNDLRGVGAHQGGLSDLPDGRTYAAAYLSFRSGSDRTPEEVDELLVEWMDETFDSIIALLVGNPRIGEMLDDGTLGEIADETPEVFLAMLEKAIAQDFPPIAQTRYVVHEVHESLQEHVSPAFYLAPAIDSFNDNVIYINPSSISDNLSLFTILAHEGYPGHMYQTVFFLQTSPHPLRVALGNTGYTEGWATYVEMKSYFYAGLPESEAAMMRYSRLYDLLFIARVDLGVNALGWDFNQVAAFCRGVGIVDSEVVENLFATVTGNPLLYMPYTLGFIELTILLESAKEELQDDFVLMDFHRFFLEFGSAPYSLIRSHMQVWMAEQAEGSLAA